MIRLLLLGLLMGLLLAGCSGAPAVETMPVEPPPSNEEPALTDVSPLVETTGTPSTVLLPLVGGGEGTLDEQAGGGQEVAVTPAESPPPARPSPSDPGGGDESSGGGMMVEGEVFVDAVELRLTDGRGELLVTGNLPTPCHIFAYELGQPDDQGRIDIQVHSLVDPVAVCAQVLQPFQETIDLGQMEGINGILVNGVPVGE